MGKLLFFPVLTFGHFNCCINLGKYLLQQYPNEHEVYFLVNELWATKLQKWAPEFKTRIYVEKKVDDFKIEIKEKNDQDLEKEIEKKKDEKKEEKKNEKKEEEKDEKKDEIKDEKKDEKDPRNEPLNVLIQEFGKTWKLKPEERIEYAIIPMVKVQESILSVEDQVVAILNELQPDLILFDQMGMIPYTLDKNIPWGQIMTMNPLFVNHPLLPPPMSGLGTDEKIYSEKWKHFRNILCKELKIINDKANAILTKKGLKTLNPGEFIYESPYLNIYIFPSQIDYFDDQKIKMKGNWIRMDSSLQPQITFDKNGNEIPFTRKSPKDREESLKKLFNFVTDEWLSKPGKLIYFSLGSMASAYLELTTRLVDVISKIPHRFIVSKGPLGDYVKLPPNCVGENFVDQKNVLKLVDLMIAHGGNNTLGECFHNAVPQIILPLFSDQPDNAIRLKETGLGGALNAFECTSEELHKKINELVNNEKLQEELLQIAQKMHRSEGMIKAVQEIAKYLNLKKQPIQN